MRFLAYRKKDISAKRDFRRKYGRESPARSTIRSWHKKFMKNGSALVKELADLKHQKKSNLVRHAPVALGISAFGSRLRCETPRSTIHKVLHNSCSTYWLKCGYLRPLSQKISRNDKGFQEEIEHRMDNLCATDGAHVEVY